MQNKFRTHLRCKKLTESQKRLLHLALTNLYNKVVTKKLTKEELLYLDDYNSIDIKKQIEKIELNEILK